MTVLDENRVIIIHPEGEPKCHQKIDIIPRAMHANNRLCLQFEVSCLFSNGGPWGKMLFDLRGIFLVLVLLLPWYRTALGY